MRALPRFAGAAAAALSAAGCGGTRAVPAVDLDCSPLPEADVRGGFVVALAEPVDPAHAPLPRNPAEATIFALLYETLTEVDCTGRVTAALAESWELSADSLTWTFRLRRDSRRGAVDAAVVRDSWTLTRRLARESGAPAWPWALVRLGSVFVVDAERLELETLAPEPDLPALLSLPEFAVALRADDAGPHDWPAGTGGRISDPEAPAPARRLVWEPADGSEDEAITFDVRPDADPRDLASAGVDVLFAGEHGPFLTGLGEWSVSALPPSREYWLVSRPGSPGDSLVAALAPTDWAAAVRTPSVPLDAPAIGPARQRGRTPSGSVEVVYAGEDGDAAALAARVVAASGSAAAVARGIDGNGYRRELGRGGGAAFVVAVPPAPAASLRRVQLETLAPWLDHGRAVPLLATRSSVATRAGLAGIECGRDGSLRLRRAGWTAEAAP
jgi:hypothetical protein